MLRITECRGRTFVVGVRHPDTISREGERKEGEMPKENHYWNPDALPNDPDLVVAWGETPEPKVLLNGHSVDRSALNRLIANLRKARDQVFGHDE